MILPLRSREVGVEEGVSQEGTSSKVLKLGGREQGASRMQAPKEELQDRCQSHVSELKRG